MLLSLLEISLRSDLFIPEEEKRDARREELDRRLP